MKCTKNASQSYTVDVKENGKKTVLEHKIVISRLENCQRILCFQRFLFPFQRKIGRYFF
jgi:hypothetical protein